MGQLITLKLAGKGLSHRTRLYISIKGMISDEKLQRKIGFTPHEGQQLVIASQARDITICAGRRWGKSAICAYLALKVLLEKDKRIWIVSPTYDLSQKVFDYLVRWYMKVAPSQANSISYRPNPRIRTPYGSWVECKSTENPQGLLGEELDLEIIDEAARMQRKIWETYLFPTTASRKGKTIKISTPFGKNWFYEQWVDSKKDGGAFTFQSKDNPYFPSSEWERAREKLPEHVFKQEYQSLFLDDAAAVFRGIREIVGRCLEDVRTDHRYVMGVDLGKYRDFTVLTVMNSVTHNVVFWDRFKDINYPLQKQRIEMIAKRYKARIVIDSTGVGDPISDDLARMGLVVDDFKFTNTSKQQLVEKLSLFIEQKALTIPDEPVLIDELESFGYELSESGVLKYQAPAGLHDDAVISLGLAVWGLPSVKRVKITNPLTGLLDRREEPRKIKHFEYV